MDGMSKRYVTTKRTGGPAPLPAGLVIDLLYASHSGGKGGSQGSRDSHAYFGVPQGDGWWFRVREPYHNILVGMCRDWPSVARHLHVDLHSVVEVDPKWHPDAAWLAKHNKHKEAAA
jgi:hypothetical protein